VVRHMGALLTGRIQLSDLLLCAMSHVRCSRIRHRTQTAHRQHQLVSVAAARSIGDDPTKSGRRKFDDVTRICAWLPGLACRQYPGFRSLLALCRWFASVDPSCPPARCMAA
jgi:hypothetical protein